MSDGSKPTRLCMELWSKVESLVRSGASPSLGGAPVGYWGLGSGSYFHLQDHSLCDTLCMFSTPAFCMVKLHYRANSYYPAPWCFSLVGPLSTLFPSPLRWRLASVQPSSVFSFILQPGFLNNSKSFAPAEENGSIRLETSHQHPHLLGQPIKLCMGGITPFPFCFPLDLSSSAPPFYWHPDQGSFGPALLGPARSLWSICSPSPVFSRVPVILLWSGHPSCVCVCVCPRTGGICQLADGDGKLWFPAAVSV